MIKFFTVSSFCRIHVLHVGVDNYIKFHMYICNVYIYLYTFFQQYIYIFISSSIYKYIYISTSYCYICRIVNHNHYSHPHDHYQHHHHHHHQYHYHDYIPFLLHCDHHGIVMSALLQLVQNSKAFLRAQQGLASPAIVESQVSRLQSKLASSIIALDEATGLVEEVTDGGCFTSEHQGLLLEAINTGTLNKESEHQTRRTMQEISHMHRFLTERDVVVMQGSSGRVGLNG